MRLLNIYHKNENDAFEALHDIYGGMRVSKWFENWVVDENNKYFEELEKETARCRRNNLNFTSEILVNGRSIPNEYDRNDLLVKQQYKKGFQLKLRPLSVYPLILLRPTLLTKNYFSQAYKYEKSFGLKHSLHWVFTM